MKRRLVPLKSGRRAPPRSSTPCSGARPDGMPASTLDVIACLTSMLERALCRILSMQIDDRRHHDEQAPPMMAGKKDVYPGPVEAADDLAAMNDSSFSQKPDHAESESQDCQAWRQVDLAQLSSNAQLTTSSRCNGGDAFAKHGRPADVSLPRRSNSPHAPNTSARARHLRIPTPMQRHIASPPRAKHRNQRKCCIKIEIRLV